MSTAVGAIVLIAIVAAGLLLRLAGLIDNWGKEKPRKGGLYD